MLTLLSEIPTTAWVGAIAVGLVTLIYLYLTWNFTYWQKQGVKCSKPWPFYGTMSNIFKKPIDMQDMEHYKKHGRIYGVYEGRKPSLHISEPELLKSILVKDFHKFQNRRKMETSKRDKVVKNFISVLRDEEWKHHRNIITPTFTTGKMKQMLLLIEECANEFMNYLHKRREKNEPIDFTQCLAGYALEVIARCAFGTKFDCFNHPDNEFVKVSTTAFSNPPKIIFLAFMFPKLAKYLPSFIPDHVIKFYTKLVYDVIEARKKEANPRKDFLQIMLEAQQECEKSSAIEDAHSLYAKYPLTDDHIIAQSMLFIFAGFETTATTLSFALYNIALHDVIQETLIREIDDVLAKNNGKLNYELVGEMQYLDMVIAETLRMYPPAVRLERECAEDCEINGIKLLKHQNIGIPIYCIHHDEEFYPEPEKFDPERFSHENRSQRNPYTYLPFGYGPRNCIGMRFALMEIKIALAYMMKEFRVKTCPTTDIPFIRKLKSTFLQPTRMNLMLEKRTDVAL